MPQTTMPQASNDPHHQQNSQQNKAAPKPVKLLRVEGWVLESLLALLVVTVFVMNIVHIAGNSMTPTLRSGEYVLVSKLEDWLTHVGVQPLQRGDIVYFRSPAGSSRWWATNHLYIKRVIGLPGDRVHMVDDQVFVNGVALPEPYTRGASRFDMPEQTVPAGHYFVMGDNRVPLGSNDSRHFGTIPKDYVRGRALLVIFPWWRNQAANVRILTTPAYATPNNSTP